MWWMRGAGGGGRGEEKEKHRCQELRRKNNATHPMGLAPGGGGTSVLDEDPGRTAVGTGACARKHPGAVLREACWGSSRPGLTRSPPRRPLAMG